MQNKLDMYLPLDNGKYVIKREKETNDFYAERHGERWRCFNGDNLVYWLCVELEQARNREKVLQDKVDKVLHKLTVKTLRMKEGRDYAFAEGLAAAASEIIKELKNAK